MPTDPAAAPSRGPRARQTFVGFFSALTLVYGVWLLVFWPGVLGQDSLAVLLEIEAPDKFHSGKTDLWYEFVRILYAHTGHVEVPIAVLMMATVAVFSRILTWQWCSGFYRTTLALMVFICAAPHMIYFAGTLYPDGIFAVAITGLLFELWRALKVGRVGGVGLMFIALTLPFAAFARPNGLIFLVPVVVAAWWFNGRERALLLLITLASIGLNLAAGSSRLPAGSHGVLFPLAIFETANFLQPRPMNLQPHSPRLTPETIELLQRNDMLEKLVSHYDPDYWDPLVFKPSGPQVMSLPQQDRNVIVKQFFTYNLWHNLPKFAGSRLNVFLVAAFAQGGLPGHGYARNVLEQTNSKSKFRVMGWVTAETRLFSLYELSARWRWLLWTPFFGIGLTIWAVTAGWARRDHALLIISVPMVVQLGAIVTFSIAGEYRYLLPFFILPVALVPAFLNPPTSHAPHPH
ncbi:hypothetical protein [Acidovorax sp. FHTAMBA]|jgi:hypothetical protein|uniref:hypothetical protein n=1 Tax=Acidovorax sp. FHTAMBA TaxID=3140252 RepID=UPI0015F6F67C